jgi:phytoene dehydrogenase-like protein
VQHIKLHGVASLDYLERAYDDSKYGRISRHPYLEVTIPSLVDQSLAPSGKHVMSVWMQYAPYRLREGEWDAETRRALGDRVIETLARYAPNLPGAIIDRQVQSPRDIETRFGLTEGHLYQGDLTLDQILFMRPVPGWSRYMTPIAGLYLAGPGSHPGGGPTGMSRAVLAASTRSTYALPSPGSVPQGEMKSSDSTPNASAMCPAVSWLRTPGRNEIL